MPGPLVCPEHRPVEGRGDARCELAPQEHRDQGVDEEGPPDERALLVAGDLRADVKRVDPHPALAQRDANAPTAWARQVHSDSRSMTDAVTPWSSHSRGLELGQVRLAAPRGPQDHQVVVELAEAIPSDQPLVRRARP